MYVLDSNGIYSYRVPAVGFCIDNEGTSTSVKALHELNEYTVPRMLWNMATFIKVVSTTKVVTQIKEYRQCKPNCWRKLNMFTRNNTHVWAKTDWLYKVGLHSLWYKHSYSFRLHHTVCKYIQNSFIRQTGNMISTHMILGTLLQFLLTFRHRASCI